MDMNTIDKIHKKYDTIQENLTERMKKNHKLRMVGNTSSLNFNQSKADK